VRDPLLLLAFGPFGPWEHNSTVDVTAAAAGQLEAEGVRVQRRVLDTSLVAVARLVAELPAQSPASVLACGLDGNSCAVRLERRARNYADFRIPDTEGLQPRGELLLAGAPAWLHSEVADQELLQRVRASGAPTELSDSAGTYICNALYFHLLHELRSSAVPALFVHLPPLPGAVYSGQGEGQQPAEPVVGLALERQVSAVVAAAAVLVRESA